MKVFLIVFISSVVGVYSQYFDGPAPPRAVIPGAAPTGQVIRRPAFRAQARQLPASIQDSPRPAGVGVIRSRRPVLRGGRERDFIPPQIPQVPVLRPREREQPAPSPAPENVSISPKPVVEEPEENQSEEEIAPPSQQSPFRPAVFRPADFEQPTRQQYENRNVQPSRPVIQEPVLQNVRPFRPSPIEAQPQRFRDEPAPQPPRYRAPAPEEPVRRVQETPRPRPQQQLNYRQQQNIPAPNTEKQYNKKERVRKPTAQVIRKYREDHPDGSITWGFENDDGTYKEETIGVDCITRGKYGYIDPDGVKREFTYSSGIPCDKDKDSESEATEDGYIDYTNNRYVFPNGEYLDLSSMVKNRARKPVHRNY